MTSILVIEDETRIADFIKRGLAAAGYHVSTASTAAEGYALALAEAFDLIVLDLGLPDEDGLALLARLRSGHIDAPVIILTARTSTKDTVAGLEGGADDYMSKPLRIDELLARIRLRLGNRHKASESTLHHLGVTLDLGTRRATKAGRAVELSSREFALAEALMRHPGQALSREQLLSRVWGYDFDPGSNVVDVYIRYLRGKLGTEFVETVRGVGYRLAAADPSATATDH